MKCGALPVLLVTAVFAGCGSGTAVAPSGGGILHSPKDAEVTEIRAARHADPRLFAIFPARPGSEPCAIPDGAGLVGKPIAGTCRTAVTYPSEHGRYPEAFVSFRESWDRHRSSWTLIVQWPAEKVVATQPHGEIAPQVRYALTD